MLLASNYISQCIETFIEHFSYIHTYNSKEISEASFEIAAKIWPSIVLARDDRGAAGRGAEISSMATVYERLSMAGAVVRNMASVRLLL